ncbi:hypothetical protein ACO0LL_13940 [Undibacterium sp. TC4M20W]|uniref:hypothetical protein n=1 Tax=unclassified Undibacterium TaxID=2630295 RepID=UPI003BF2A4A5
MRILIIIGVLALLFFILLAPPELTQPAGRVALLSCKQDQTGEDIWECLGIKLGKIALEALYSYFSIGHIKL